MTTRPRIDPPEDAASSDPFRDPLLIGIGIAVLIVTMLKQRIATGPGVHAVTGDGILMAAATVYAELIAAGREL